MESKLVGIDLFCGAGGLSLGLEMAGIRMLAGLEADPIAHRTFAANHPRVTAFREPVDITTVTAEDAWRELGRPEGELDLVAGGPPCQGFSTAGERRAKDERNSLVFHFARLVAELRPRFFVMENVVGILSMRGSSGRLVLDALSEEFGRSGYRTNIPVDPRRRRELVVNAADHGVPQKRRRVLVLGALDAPVPDLGPATHHEPGCLPFGKARPHVTVAEALDDLPPPTRDEPQSLPPATGLSDFARKMRRRARAVHNHVPTRHRPFMVERMRAQPPGTPLYDTWAHAWYRLVADQPAPTVKENHNAPFVHHEEPRVVTPRECARLQSFPDDFAFEGPKSRQLVQIGNAVPPLLGRAVGEAVLRAAGACPATSPAGVEPEESARQAR